MIEQIEQVPAWRYGNTVYPTHELAQRAGIARLFADEGVVGDKIADTIISHKDEVVAILTGTKPRRKRSDAGKPHAKPAKIPTRIKDMPVDGGKFPENAGVTIEPSSKYRGK